MSTHFRDLWAKGKQVSPDLFSRMKTGEWATKLRDDIAALRHVWRDVSFAQTFPEFYAAIDRLAETSRRISFTSHEVKGLCDWMIPPVPEFNDQFVNQFYITPGYKRTFWLEGAIFCGIGIKPGKRILELCCGAGYYTDLFYSPFASEIVAVDLDPRAIEMAQQFHQCPNVRYEVMDIRKTFPNGVFETVIWDGAIEHFTEAEIDSIMTNMRRAMTADACLLGYTVAESARRTSASVARDSLSRDRPPRCSFETILQKRAGVRASAPDA